MAQEPQEQPRHTAQIEDCGYTAFHNDDAKDELWRINGKRQVIYRRWLPRQPPAQLATGRLVRCSAAPLLLHDDRRADLDPVIEIDHVLIGQANAAR
jgi:hypothetical protein